MSNAYNDTNAICQVIGNIYNDPSLLDIEDKYKIHEEDFCEEFHKVVYGCLYKLHELGAKQFTLENIADFLSSRPKSQGIYELNKGEEYLTRVSSIAERNSFDYYYNRMKKMTLLRMYNKYGIDVTDIYDPDNVLDVKKRQIQEEKLDNSTLREIADLVDEKIDGIRAKCVDDYTEEAYQAGEGLRALVDSFKEHPEVGIPMYGPLINTITRGARLKKFYLRSGGTGLGKAIPNDTYIPTPTGMRQVKDIKIGDMLFSEKGEPTRVLAVYPQKELQDIYEIHFLDGRIAKCSGEHLWEYRFKTDRKYEIRIETAKEMLDRINNNNGKYKSPNNTYKYAIKTNKAVRFERRKLPERLPPYLLGFLLNLSSFTIRETKGNVVLNTTDTELIDTFLKFFPNYKCVKDDDIKGYIFVNNLEERLLLKDILKEVPQLYDCPKNELSIPEDYLINNLENRRELLRGFLDSSNSVKNNELRLILKLPNKIILEQCMNLCRSLGITFSVTNKPEENLYILKLAMLQEEKYNYITLESKREQLKCGKIPQIINSEWVSIVNIIKTDEKVPMTCFTVANPSHLFLMNDYIVTHNTRTMIADACFFACNTYYEGEIGSWIRNGVKEPTLYITTEQSLDEVQTMMLAFLSEVNEEHILNNTYEGDEEERIQKAIEVLEDSPLYIEELPDFSLQDIENVIKKNIREHDVRYVCHDYIHSSMKILEEISSRSGGVRLREDNILFMLSNKLKDLCNKYGIFLLSGTQLNANIDDAEATPDQNMLRGAKSIADWTNFYNL